MEIIEHPAFNKWPAALRDRQARARIVARLFQVQGGNLGDHKSVGSGVWELRFKFGPGYRVYYMQKGSVVVLLLCGGDKNSQPDDILKAKALAAELEGKL